MAADYILTHIQDFGAFIEGEIDIYCNDIRQNAWGGHIEILALSKALDKQIQIIQTDSDITVGDTGDLLIITYHKHEYGLGEHYNSVIAL
jgi:OTU domain-containing protein 6